MGINNLNGNVRANQNLQINDNLKAKPGDELKEKEPPTAHVNSHWTWTFETRDKDGNVSLEVVSYDIDDGTNDLHGGWFVNGESIPEFEH